MKKLSVLMLLLLSFTMLKAQRMSVQSFALKDYDMTATLADTKRTSPYDNRNCALIKVITTQDDFLFDGVDYEIVGDVLRKPGEYWVYVPAQAKAINISHYIYGVLKNYYFDMPLESGRTYEMYIDPGVGKYVSIVASQPNAIVFLDGDSIGMSPIQKKYVVYGKHKISAKNRFSDGEIDIMLINDGNKTIENLYIEMPDPDPNYAEVTIICDDPLAQLNVAGESGVGHMSLRLPKGDYVIVASRGQCDDAVTSFSVADGESVEIIAAAPVPLTGRIKFDTKPAITTVEIAGNTYSSEDTITLPVGEYFTVISKRGYHKFKGYEQVLLSNLFLRKIELASCWAFKSDDLYFGVTGAYSISDFDGWGPTIGKVFNNYNFTANLLFGKNYNEVKLEDTEKYESYERKGYLVSVKAGKILSVVEPHVGLCYHHLEGGNMAYVLGGLRIVYAPFKRNELDATFLFSFSADYNVPITKAPDLPGYKNLGLLLEASLLYAF